MNFNKQPRTTCETVGYAFVQRETPAMRCDVHRRREGANKCAIPFLIITNLLHTSVLRKRKDPSAGNLLFIITTKCHRQDSLLPVGYIVERARLNSLKTVIRWQSGFPM